jgi:hypothetical protein
MYRQTNTSAAAATSLTSAGSAPERVSSAATTGLNLETPSW